ncbi:possible glyoxylase family protein [Vibrio ishigakensis]|uniref:Possible glyoxylase family protein n=1 Tax=Vibrio ishigakensis TaxID=1481914 RepID=A0A0B8QBA6_9VIBR|nr:VOC family protein [Vibrio ishigakensis]GAM55091.1 possible glyoxylase family protein [Vibrio ishigakensis]GAM61203.1 possible glyoxylase family protein [Vibrio ishigakensis]GAM75926.1 possible glyoxylase family protein [Vibrio ishigakensis]
MKIEHIAIWCEDLEKMKSFYETFFNAKSNNKYENPKKGFSSYFLSLSEGARIELMKMDSVETLPKDVQKQFTGMAHVAFSLGSVEKVEALTESFASNGFEVISGPRWTGDGYYESEILDPEGNRVEITT